MQTVLYVSPMRTGDEVEVRRIHEAFPLEALDAGTGVERLVAFIGSGLYAMEVTVGSGDFQEKFHRFLGRPTVQELFAKLRPFVENLPAPAQDTADMPLAVPMLAGPGAISTAILLQNQARDFAQHIALCGCILGVSLASYLILRVSARGARWATLLAVVGKETLER